MNNHGFSPSEKLWSAASWADQRAIEARYVIDHTRSGRKREEASRAEAEASLECLWLQALARGAASVGR